MGELLQFKPDQELMDEVMECWQYCCGAATPYIYDALAQMLEGLDRDVQALMDCIRITARAPRPSLAYLSAVVRNRRRGVKPWEVARVDRAGMTDALRPGETVTPARRALMRHMFDIEKYTMHLAYEEDYLIRKSAEIWAMWPHTSDDYKRYQIARWREE